MRAIVIRGAREGCLRGIDLEIPLGKLTCLAGPAGGGARTLAVEVLHREGRRRYLQALSAFEREYRESLQKAEVNEILGLPPAVMLPGTPPRRTVSDFIRFSEVAAILFESHGESMCPACLRPCAGYTVSEATRHAVESMAGKRALVSAPVTLKKEVKPGAVMEEIRRAGFPRVLVAGEIVRTEEITSDVLARFNDTLQVVVDRLEVGEDTRDRIAEGLRTARQMSGGRSLLVVEGTTIPLNQQLTCTSCGRENPDCGDDGLQERGSAGSQSARLRSSLVGSTLEEVLEMRIDRAALWLEDVRESTSGSPDAFTRGVLEEAAESLSRLTALGLHHVPLQRSAADLASGEWLRLVLARTAARALTGVLYIHEPCSGLDEKNLRAVIQTLGEVVAAGNTVVVLDNDPMVAAACDGVFEFRNGEISAARDTKDDDPAGAKAVSPAGRPCESESATSIRIRGEGGGKQNNLRAIDTVIPTGKLVVVTGVSGAGATSLLRDAIAPAVRPAGARGGSRTRKAEAGRGGISVSTGNLRRITDLRDLPGNGDEPVLQLIGLLAPIAALYSRQPVARAFGLKPEWFHLDRPGGRCKVCEGRGQLRFTIEFLDHVTTPCPSCEGGRYSEEALEVTHRGRSPRDILDMTVLEARQHFIRERRIAPRLDTLSRYGMGGYGLGEPIGRLELLERLRLQLAVALSRASEKDLLLLDAPLVGAHPDDASTLVDLAAAIVSKRGTVIVADRHPKLLQSAGRVLALGPGSGPDGGLIVAEGVPK